MVAETANVEIYYFPVENMKYLSKDLKEELYYIFKGLKEKDNIDVYDEDFNNNYWDIKKEKMLLDVIKNNYDQKWQFF